MPRHHVLRTFGAENHHDLPRLGHLDALHDRDHQHVVLRELKRHAPDSVLPDRARVLQTVQGDQTRRILAEVDSTVVLLETWKSDAHVWVSGPDDLLRDRGRGGDQGPRPGTARRAPRRGRVHRRVDRLAHPPPRRPALGRSRGPLPVAGAGEP